MTRPPMRRRGLQSGYPHSKLTELISASCYWTGAMRRTSQRWSPNGDLHKLWQTTIPVPLGVTEEIDRRNRLRQKGDMPPFAVIDKHTGKAVGITTCMNIETMAPRLEIGSTWYCRSAQETGLNTECKLLLLHNAVENLNCLAVEFRTHVINHQSRRSIEQLGTTLDGILRAHMVMQTGRSVKRPSIPSPRPNGPLSKPI